MELPSTLIFDYPTINAITKYLAATMQPASSANGHTAYDQPYMQFADGLGDTGLGTGAVVPAAASAPVLVAAVACRQPRQVLTDGTLGGMDSMSRIPLDRWDADRQAPLVGGAPIPFASTIEVRSTVTQCSMILLGLREL